MFLIGLFVGIAFIIGFLAFDNYDIDAHYEKDKHGNYKRSFNMKPLKNIELKVKEDLPLLDEKE